MAIIEVKNLIKKYEQLTALENFSISVREGELIALVGPDGAGKTSLFRSLCGLIDFDAGGIEILGYDVRIQFDKIKPLLGYMPQVFSLYPDLSVEENLRFYAGLFGLDRRKFESKKNRLYEFSGLGPFARRRAMDLSGGMKQKLALSCNLIHDPQILILDEPTTGVDPYSRQQFWDILQGLRDKGSSIVVATPYMDEVALADKAVFIYEGRKLIEGKPDEILSEFKGNLYSLPISAVGDSIQIPNDIPGIQFRRFGASIRIQTIDEFSLEKLTAELKPTGIDLRQAEIIAPDLEDLFIQLMSSQ